MYVCPQCGIYTDPNDPCCPDRQADYDQGMDENELWAHIAYWFSAGHGLAL